MRKLMARDETWLVVITTTVSIMAFLFFKEQGTILGYKDSLSHLLIGRRIFVGETPGLGQLGGIWLPLQHVFIMFLAWNDFLYLSGLAGSVFSMACYVGSVLCIYKIILYITDSRAGGWTAASVFGLCTNMLYLQSTPMGETMMYFGILLAVLSVVRWIQTDNHMWLFVGAIVCMLLVFVRYEGWVFSAGLWFVVLYTCFVKKHRIITGDQAGQAYLLVFGFFMSVSVALWLIWNQIIFGDWLQWLRGAYGSKAQTSNLDIVQAGDPIQSILTYWYASEHTIQVPFIIGGTAGLLIMAFKERLSPIFATFLSTGIPGTFLVYGLYSGSQPMEVIEINGGLYNLRMAVVMIIPISLFIGYLVAHMPSWRMFSLALPVAGMLACISAMYVVIGYNDNGDSVITNREAKIAYDAYAEQREVGSFIKSETQGRILIESIFNEWVIFPNQERVIYEGSQELWESSLIDPTGDKNRISVIVMRSTPGDNDSVYNAMYGTPVLNGYGIVLQTDNFLIYERGSSGGQTRK
jgi:hypothetical protein